MGLKYHSGFCVETRHYGDTCVSRDQRVSDSNGSSKR